VDRFDSGEVYVHEKRVNPHTPQDGIREGIAYLPEDRKSLGLIQNHTIRDNYAYPSLYRISRFGIVNQSRLDKEVVDIMARLAVKAPNAQTFAMQLSGGNQQKVVVAKWLGAQCQVLIFDEPTRGIDINGRREIYGIMEELLERGVGILMLTSDYAEALEMSHRVVVMRHGALCAEFKRGEAAESDILREAIGALTADPESNSVGATAAGASR
jgi:ribose transport system ATP-binding protein